MISTDFLLFFFTVFGFLWFFFVFCFSWVLYYFLFGFIYIFKCFWSHTSQGTTGPRIPPSFLVREFSVLTRLNSIHGNPEGFRVPNYPSAPAVLAY